MGVETNGTGGAGVVGWPSAIVASTIVLLIGAVTVTAIIKYDTTDEALKIWASLSTVVGLLTGAFVTFFFTRGAMQSAQLQADLAQRQMNWQLQAADGLRHALIKTVGFVPEAKWEELLKDPVMQFATSSPSLSSTKPDD